MPCGYHRQLVQQMHCLYTGTSATEATARESCCDSISDGCEVVALMMILLAPTAVSSSLLQRNKNEGRECREIAFFGLLKKFVEKRTGMQSLKEVGRVSCDHRTWKSHSESDSFSKGIKNIATRTPRSSVSRN